MTTITWLWHGSCEETAEHLSDHLENELRGLRRFRILRHLASCALCAAAFWSLRRTVGGLRALCRSEPVAAPALADVVVERIRRDGGLGR
jgi:predicted anti-sigma-YlaC factor YlaD